VRTNNALWGLWQEALFVDIIGRALQQAGMKPTFTIGIEEEYQTVDPVSRDLRSHIHAEMIEKGKMRLQERVKAEMHQSVVEVGTSVCTNIKDAKDEVKKLRRDMIMRRVSSSSSRSMRCSAVRRLSVSFRSGTCSRISSS